MQTLNKRHLIFGLVLLGVGLFAFLVAIYNVYLANQSKTWQRTDARVVSVETGHCKGNRATLSITYAFIVDQKSYTGTRYSFGGPGCMDTGFVNDKANALRNTGKISIAYNPDDPAQCTVITGREDGYWMGILIAPCYVMILGVIVVFIKQDKSGRLYLRRKSNTV